jgi:enamine deaminase RidA (YjgF/YER057c/UK114 family)
MIFSAGLKGKDPALNRASDDPSEQMAEVFRTMTRFLEAAGVTVEDVIRVDVTLSSKEYREHLNAEWAKYFNDEESLPVRKAKIEPLTGNFIAEIEVIAVAP